MTTRAALSLSISTLMIGAAVIGVADASTRVEQTERQADKEAAAATKALTKRKYEAAVVHAEAAVGLSPESGRYRTLLGTSYLKAGRFASARQAFDDAVTLDPANGKAALNLALAQTALGDWAAAQKTLATYASVIPASDRGLAMALAGNPAGGVDVLSDAVRSPAADAKARQNLALAFALAGRWQDAKTMVAIDMAPADVDARIMQWASFSKPTAASDQVASLLGVTPVADAGQPVALALNAQAGVAVASAAPVTAVPPVAVAAPAPTEVVTPVAVASVPDATELLGSAVRFGARREVLQALPARVAVAAPARWTPVIAIAAKIAPAATWPAPKLASGSFVVQIGAFQNAAVAKDAWGRATRRYAAFGKRAPQGMDFAVKSGSLYRLSVGGFARADADRLCRDYRSKGGACFVRAGAGDQVASWTRPTGVKLASR